MGRSGLAARVHRHDVGNAVCDAREVPLDPASSRVVRIRASCVPCARSLGHVRAAQDLHGLARSRARLPPRPRGARTEERGPIGASCIRPVPTRASLRALMAAPRRRWRSTRPSAGFARRRWPRPRATRGRLPPRSRPCRRLRRGRETVTRAGSTPPADVAAVVSPPSRGGRPPTGARRQDGEDRDPPLHRVSSFPRGRRAPSHGRVPTQARDRMGRKTNQDLPVVRTWKSTVDELRTCSAGDGQDSDGARLGRPPATAPSACSARRLAAVSRCSVRSAFRPAPVESAEAEIHRDMRDASRARRRSRSVPGRRPRSGMDRLGLGGRASATIPWIHASVAALVVSAARVSASDTTRRASPTAPSTR